MPAMYLLTSGCTSTRGGGRRGPTNSWTGPTSASRTIRFWLSQRLNRYLTGLGGPTRRDRLLRRPRSHRYSACLSRHPLRPGANRSGQLGPAGYCERAVETDEQEAFVRNFTS